MLDILLSAAGGIAIGSVIGAAFLHPCVCGFHRTRTAQQPAQPPVQPARPELMWTTQELERARHTAFEAGRMTGIQQASIPAPWSQTADYEHVVNRAVADALDGLFTDPQCPPLQSPTRARLSLIHTDTEGR